ncbi:MAG: SRPBCC domain-containing protein [Salaquimonas sp.]
MSETSITKTVFFKASRKTVWEFLTDKDKLGEWFHPAENNLSDGNEYALMGKADDGGPKKICWGEVTAWNPYSELAYSFTVGPMGGVLSQVHWKLEEVGAGTRLILEHTNLATTDDAFGIVMAFDAGWDRHFASLRESLA